MNSKRKRKKRGFTLIEVIIVLALVGLILIGIFLAVSQVQKSRRDAQRKQYLAQFAAAVNQYSANHKLHTPDDLDANLSSELDDLMLHYFGPHKDPLSGNDYQLDYWNRGAPHDLNNSLQMDHIAFVQGHVCGSTEGASTIVTDTPSYSFTEHAWAAVIKLEQGGMLCSDDN